MKRFDDYMKHFSDVEGWFQTPAIAIWDSLLSYQQEQGISGNLIEIGVWKGKSAALAALHCQGSDACVFVDAMPLDEAKARISQGYAWHHLPLFAGTIAVSRPPSFRFPGYPRISLDSRGWRT